MIANNAFPLSFFGLLAGDCTAKALRAASCAAQQSGVRRRLLSMRCSGYRDIHKNLWISLWIVAE
jgi:hypothetical protein